MGGFPARQMGQRKMQISGWSGSKFSANQHSDPFYDLLTCMRYIELNPAGTGNRLWPVQTTDRTHAEPANQNATQGTATHEKPGILEKNVL
jgi:hypothetical protein